MQPQVIKVSKVIRLVTAKCPRDHITEDHVQLAQLNVANYMWIICYHMLCIMVHPSTGSTREGPNSTN
jgi:hypothetical protein